MKCFYHNDIDGRCAGSIVAKWSGNCLEKDFFEVDYVMDLPIDKVPDGDEVWFVDYSFKENTIHIINDLLDRGCDVIWIDHHTSSINLQNDHPLLKNIRGIRKEGISGAALTYMYCHSCEFEDVPYYIKLVSDYDCWKYKYNPDTTYFKIGIELQKYNALDCIWSDLYENSALSNLKYAIIIENGKTIKNYIDNDNTIYRNNFAYETEILGHKCLVVNKKSNSWIFGDKYDKYPLVMTWVFNGKKYSYSIFSSNKDIDCSKIAESYGGGGHKGAAGFSSDELLFLNKI